MDLGITIVRANPRTCCVDRLVYIIAAKELYGVPAIVIDYGTANTFDAVNEKNEFITGFITAGMKTCSELPYQRTAQLPKLELVRPETTMAKTKVSSLIFLLISQYRNLRLQPSSWVYCWLFCSAVRMRILVFV